MTDADDAARVGLIGKRLGRYLIAGELGRGGMATVYRARDPQLGREVALKVMHGFFAGRAELEARFSREATAVAAIKHPGILAVFDFATPAGEEPGYLVSEIIEGPSLRAVLEARGGRLAPELAMAIVARVADALGAAHAAGIVHRDVKPDNVLIDRAGPVARVVLTDFGVAHVSALDTMTATGAVLGSPAYMSPEQARGDDVTPTSDVFALGVMLYQLVTGHLPFAGKDPLTVIAAILRGEYRRPSTIEPRVSPALERLIAGCLAVEPSARPPHGGAVAAALRDLLKETWPDAEKGAALDAALDDPTGFAAELAPRVTTAALAAAREAVRRRQTPRALAEVGRALAYDPHNAEAQALLAKIGARASWRSKRFALALAGVATAVLAGGGLWLANRSMGPGAGETTRALAGVRDQVANAIPARRGTGAPGTTETGASREPVGRDTTASGPGTSPSEQTVAAAGAGHDGTRSPSAREGHAGGVGPTAATATGDSENRPTAARGSKDKSDRARARLAGGAIVTGSPRITASTTTRTGTPHGAGTSPSGAPSAAGPPAGATAPAVSVPGGAGSRPAAGGSPGVADSQPNSAAGTGSSASGASGASGAAAATASTTPSSSGSQATASLVLRAAQAFCEPSLDDGSPSLRAVYKNLVPGSHIVYCTVPGQPKVLVTRYQLLPGTHPSLIIVRGPDGKPQLGRQD